MVAGTGKRLVNVGSFADGKEMKRTVAPSGTGGAVSAPCESLQPARSAGASGSLPPLGWLVRILPGLGLFSLRS